MKNNFEDLTSIYRLEITYPESAVEVYEDWSTENETIETFVRLDRNWKPVGWEASAEWIERFETDRFFWPSVKPFYNTRSTANIRARLFRKYGATVVVRRSKPIEWHYTETEILAARVRELEAQIADNWGSLRP